MRFIVTVRKACKRGGVVKSSEEFTTVNTQTPT
jgi:hypothetical protein